MRHLTAELEASRAALRASAEAQQARQCLTAISASGRLHDYLAALPLAAEWRLRTTWTLPQPSSRLPYIERCTDCLLQAAQRQSDDVAASGRLLAERDAQIERLREELTGYKEERDLEMEALTEERDRLDAALAVRPGFESRPGFRVQDQGRRISCQDSSMFSKGWGAHENGAGRYMLSDMTAVITVASVLTSRPSGTATPSAADQTLMLKCGTVYRSQCAMAIVNLLLVVKGWPCSLACPL